ncbi:tetratricopeptide repeat protein [Rhodoferax sp. AJA081-3]|uniref:O-linked N-acetylglucosamine transferase, SPINDLY family protein n=1 Tax=Rhodoferax sp. AJA081-3 TaxID=2752316 RepID=UPI001ADEDA3D|nr:tetratricopeptide repeat protein [Rhodoferax sp. AJA081-3]QTN26108.1 tetratricopeptide repeat protein [Rhodoferax sp. AJA081-3]
MIFNEERAHLETAAAEMEALYNIADYAALEIRALAFTDQYPNIGFGWSVLGTALQLQSKDAVEANEKAVLLLPDDAVAHMNLGDALMATNQPQRAVASYKAAIDLKGGNPALHTNLGNALTAVGAFAEAHANYIAAQQLQPDFAEAYYNQAIAYSEQRSLDNAEVCLRQAIKLKSNHATAYIQLASLLKDSGRAEEAEACCRRGLEFRPDFAEAHSNHGAILDDLGRVEEAAAAFQRAIQLMPNFATAHSNLLFHYSHSENISPQDLYKAHLDFAERFETPLISQWSSHPNNRDPNRIIRMGFVSGDLRVHAVASFFEPILAHLARCTKLSLYAYNNSPYEDTVTQRLKSNISHWRQIAGQSDDAVAQMVRDDCIDILIDLSGHTAYNRLLTFARKPAPIQASWIGYAGTTGLSAMDYYFGDQYWLPRGRFEDQFSEKIVRLPANALFLPFVGAPDVNVLPALRNGYLTFGSFNQLRKLTPTVIAVWSQILRAIPNSRMLMAAMPVAGENSMLVDMFAREGIARERLSFHPRAHMQDYLALHHQVDVSLDTFPYPGATTSCHALWMGVPTVTLVGSTPVSRVGAVLQNHAGLPQFIASNRAEFVAKSVYWAEHFDELAAIRADTRIRFGHSAMGQPDMIGAAIEQALRQMWQRWCAGHAPESIDVLG